MMGAHQKGEGGSLHLAEYRTGQGKERKLSEVSEGEEAHVGFLRRWDKGEDHSKADLPHSCRCCSWPSDVENPGPGTCPTLTDKMLLLFSEEQMRTQVNWDALATQP